MDRPAGRENLPREIRDSWCVRLSQMTAEESRAVAKKIVGLFPELLGIGGIQEAGRLTASALDGIAFQREYFEEFLGLNDPLGPQTLEASLRTIPFRGCGRGKIRFLIAGIRAGRPFE